MLTADDEALVADLFALVDQDHDGSLDFTEVTALFWQLAPEQSVESAQNAAVEALLLSDHNADKRLNRLEFQQLLTKVAQLSDVPLAEAAQRLLDVTRQQQQQQQQQQSQGAGPVEAVVQQPGAAVEAVSSVPGGLQELFQLWDKEGDGRISFTELCHGLSKMKQPIKHKKDITALITEAGSVLAAHDSDGDRQLDLQEFSSFMQQFMAAAGFELPAVVDDLITLTQHKPDNEKLQRVLEACEPQIQHMLSS